MLGRGIHTTCHLWLTAIAIMLLAAVGAFVPTAAYADGGNGADQAVFKAELSYSGYSAPEETFEVYVEPLDGAPNPVSSVTQASTLSLHVPKGEVEFAFSFDEVGWYRYKLAQVKGSNPHISYSDAEYLVEFEVYHDVDGLTYMVHASRMGDDEDKPALARFDNTYNPSSTVLSDPPIKVTKSIAGDRPPEKSTFVFVMEPEDSSFPLPKPNSAAVQIQEGKVFITLQGEGEVEIGQIEFIKPGVYRYHIRERDDKVAGYSYDNAVFDVVYTVTTDPTTGELVCVRDMRRSGSTWSGECSFTNTYSKSGGGGRSGQAGSSVIPKVLANLLPKTADELLLMMVACAALAAMAAGVCLAVARRRRVAVGRSSGQPLGRGDGQPLGRNEDQPLGRNRE